jgi:molecular chaperone DnaK (HSP70)
MSRPVAVSGIDFGNHKCVVGVYQDGAVRFIAGPTGNSIPTTVSFFGWRRYWGDRCREHLSLDPKSTFIALKQLMCLPFNFPRQQNLQISLPFDLVGLPDGMTGVQAEYRDKNVVLRPEQLVGFLLRELSNLTRESDLRADYFVIGVPPNCGERERRSLLAAARIAKIQCLSLLNETTAVAFCYAHQWGQRLAESETLAMFVDCGHSATSVCIAKFQARSLEIVICRTTDECSGTVISEEFYRFMLGKIQVASGVRE